MSSIIPPEDPPRRHAKAVTSLRNYQRLHHALRGDVLERILGLLEGYSALMSAVHGNCCR